MKECEYCGNKIVLDDTRGRYVCTVCYAESQTATKTTEEYDETLNFLGRGVEHNKVLMEMMERDKTLTERDYFYCYQVALKQQALFLIHTKNFSPNLLDALRLIWFTYLKKQKELNIRFQRKLTRGNFKNTHLNESYSRSKIHESQLFNSFFEQASKRHESDTEISVWDEHHVGTGEYLVQEKTKELPLDIIKFKKLMNLADRSRANGARLLLHEFYRDRRQIRRDESAQKSQQRHAKQALNEERMRKARALNQKLKKAKATGSKKGKEKKEKKEKDGFTSSEGEESSQSEEEEGINFGNEIEEALKIIREEEEQGEEEEEDEDDEDDEKEEKEEEEEEESSMDASFLPDTVIAFGKKTHRQDVESKDKARLAMETKRAQLEKNGLPKFRMSLSFLILAAAMVGETFLPSDAAKWAMERELPYLEFGILFNQFNVHTSNFIISVPIGPRVLCRVAQLIATIVDVLPIVPPINYPPIIIDFMERLKLPKSLFPIAIEIGQYQKWDFKRGSIGARVMSVIVILLTMLYPVREISPNTLSELIKVPKEEIILFEEEASLLFYLQELPSFGVWLSQQNEDAKDAFASFMDKAENQLRSVSQPSKGALECSSILRTLSMKNESNFETKGEEDTNFEIDDSEWEDSPMYKLHAARTYPVYKKGRKERHSTHKAIIGRLASEISIPPNVLAKNVKQLEAAIRKELHKTCPLQIPNSAYRNDFF